MKEDAHSKFKAAYDLHYKRSYNFVKSYVFDDEACKDIVASSFTSLWSFMQEKEVENVAALLLTILRNNSLNYLRHEAVKRSAMDTMTELRHYELSLRITSLEACDPSEIFTGDIQRIIDDPLRSLPQQTRWIFVMSRYDGLSYSKIAQLTHLSEKAVEYHINKALKSLRLSLRDYLPMLGPAAIGLLSWFIHP